MRIHAVLAASLVLAAISGCGVGSGHVASQDGQTTVGREFARAHDVDLVVSSLASTPKGPTTATTIVLHATFANRGGDCTPYGYTGDTLRYVPFRYAVSRDGEVIAGGEIMGLTGDDAVTRDITLLDQPPGDKTYVVTIDSTDAIGETDEDDNQATVVVIYGGSG